MNNIKVYIVMGVSGCGKSTISQLLAKKLDLPYFDGDDFHPEENVLKMSKGHPLNDGDRQAWLQALNKLAINHRNKGAIIACSALKEQYRDILRTSINDAMQFIYLEGTFDEINERMQARKGHFMPAGLLKSQFETLEPPKTATSVSIIGTPEEIVQNILKQL
ncbi:gluconokinase [Aurantibacter sp.]|uniref:gluconokinase n=1 Tax=Aurantibacter sp. TaxID=2807103 RepID=UPI003264E533